MRCLDIHLSRGRLITHIKNPTAGLMSFGTDWPEVFFLPVAHMDGRSDNIKNMLVSFFSLNLIPFTVSISS